ncbi:MAG TPA: potassium channel protein [Thermodesulfovibrionales bacterium]|nr:potassium channel protein [Thermodesulfovibrionales bacterium]
MTRVQRQFIVSLLLIALVIFFGTAGYILIEGWATFDSLYMTLITITTVGYGEVHKLSHSGRVFTLFLILFGVGTILYTFNNAARIVIEGEIQEIFGRKKVERRIRELKNHYIVCGYGRMGSVICKELREKDAEFVVVERQPSAIEGAETDTLFIKGDATRDEVLREAGIERAKGLISVLPTDAENLYVVLSAKVLNPDLNIVARAGEEGSEQKLLRAGADRVVSPYHIGGLRIAHTVLKPSVVDFIEFATRSGNIDLQMEEIYVHEGASIAGSTLDHCGIGRELGIIIVAIKRIGGDMRFNPTFKTVIKPGDILIALGENTKLKLLEEMAEKK